MLLRARRTRYDRRMKRALLLALLVATPLAAQTKKEAKPKDSAEAKPEKSTKDDDVVIDNRGLAKKRAIEQEEKESSMFENDTPFANTAPDPEGLREQRWKPGIGGGYRFGFAFPMGDLSGQQQFSDAVDGLIFVGGEIGYWFDPHFFAGLALSGGYVLPDCGGNNSCSGWEVRGGPMVMARIDPFANIAPFVALGLLGYEWMTLGSSNEVTDARSNVHGLEYFNLQAGIDVKSRGDFYGIFVSYSMGKFTKFSTSIESNAAALNFEDSGDIQDPKIHSWLGIGARGTLE